MQTAKTIQLRDGSNNFISPATNIESLYYETTGTDENQNIIYRKQLSKYFPVYVNLGNDTPISNYKVATKNTSILDLDNASTRLVDADGNDIIISKYMLRRIKGTNYYTFDVSSYNLSVMLLSYAGVTYVDKRILNLSTYIQSKYQVTIDVINKVFVDIQNQIDNLSTNISNTSTKYDELVKTLNYKSTQDYNTLKKLKDNEQLITGCAYKLLYRPAKTISSDLYFDHPFILVLNAVDNKTFSNNVVSCMVYNNQYFNLNDLGEWDVKYDFDKKVDNGKITYNDLQYTVNQQIESICLSPFDNGQTLIKVKKVYLYGNNIIALLKDGIDKIATETWINLEGTVPPSGFASGTMLYIENVSIIPASDMHQTYFQKTDGSGLIRVIDDSDVVYPTGEITYMKDEFGNEAPFDFKSRKQKYNDGTYKHMFSYLDRDFSLNPNCSNNIVKSNSKNIVFYTSVLCDIKYNQIGYNSDLIYFTNDQSSMIHSNIIGDNNNIILLKSSVLENPCTDNIIGNNNVSIKISNGYNNNIANKCNNVTIDSKSNNNEICSQCTNITLSPGSSYNVVNCKCGLIKIDGTYNIVESGCYNVKFNNTLTNVTVGPYNKNVVPSEDNKYYTCQTIYARGFESRL